MIRITTLRILAVLAALGVAGLATGCNTMEGLGKDISKAGSTLEGAAKKNK
jgi:predicted small secreted protein